MHTQTTQVTFTQLPPDEEAKVLALMTFDERQEYRKRQFHHRVALRQEQAALEYEASALKAKEAKEARVKAAKQRQAANRAAHTASNQRIRSDRNANCK